MLEECSSFFPVGAGWLIDGVWFLMFFFPRYTLGLLLIVAMCLHADQNLAAPNLTLGSPMAIDLYWKKKYLCTAQLPVHMPVLGPFKGSLNNVEQDIHESWTFNLFGMFGVEHRNLWIFQEKRNHLHGSDRSGRQVIWSHFPWPLRSAIAEEFDLTALEKDSKLGGQVQLGTWDLWYVESSRMLRCPGCLLFFSH